ncbi:MAG: radical SAM/SPASM family putative metalloenzyme maturase [Desulfocapsaceae bacterium]
MIFCRFSTNTQPKSSPYLKTNTIRNMDFPKSIYVELTTRCNLQCSKCVKYTAGSCIPECDIELDVLHHLLPSLATIENLILSGIGESLLHPNLSEIIGLARKHMPASGTIGLQSNGYLLDRDKAVELIEQGLTSLCFSVDSFNDTCSPHHETGEHSFQAVKEAVENVNSARQSTSTTLDLGLQIVLTDSSIEDLPSLVSWAAKNRIDYIIASHLIQYDSEVEKENLFNSHSLEAIQLYKKYCAKAASIGLSFEREFNQHRKTAGTKTNDGFSDLLDLFFKEARHSDIRLNFDHIKPISSERTEEIKAVLDKAQKVALGSGIEFHLPHLHANHQRECRFLRDKTTFISANGDVTPCHFLWHTYSTQVFNENIKVRKRVYGNIGEKSLENIWLNKQYRIFRTEAEQYEYSSCWSCPQGPCASLVNDASGYANDCFGSQVPCGHCQWNLGGIRCL